MPGCFLDTNILLRLADANSPQHRPAKRAVAEIRRQGEAVFITAQI
jgi:predicted nucleic acid-binding protein